MSKQAIGGIQIETTQYEWVHGCKPRGFGAWWFSADGHSGVLPFSFEHTGLYSEARKSATAEFKRYARTWQVSHRTLKVNA